MNHPWTATIGRGAIGPTTGRANLWVALAGALACMMAGQAQAGGDGDDPFQSGVSFYLDPDKFDRAVAEAGMVLKGIEDFSEMNLPPNAVAAMDDPLDADTDNKYWDPGDIIDNLTFQSNLDRPGDNGPNPAIDNGLAIFTIGFIGATHNGVVANTLRDSFDILLGPPGGENHTAVALNLVTFGPPEAVNVLVFDKEENLLGSIDDVPAPVFAGGFLGILAMPGKVIGRVNIWDPTPQGNGLAAEGVYEVAAYVSGPCSWDLDGDDDVGVGDLLIVLGAWGPNPGHPADFDGNGDVGVSDLLALLANWGPCP